MTLISEERTEETSGSSVAVLGGGLAGITAAWTARQAGYRVVLFERGRYLGGRIASLEETGTSTETRSLIDNGEHIWLSACHAVEHLFHELDLTQFFDFERGINFSCGMGRFWTLKSCGYLPRRWAFIPAILRFQLLSFRERLNLIRLSGLLLKEPEDKLAPRTFCQWFEQNNGMQKTAEFFWRPMILSSLSDLPEHVSALAVRKVMLEGILFCAQKKPGLYLPNCPLRSIFHDAVYRKFQEAGIEVRLLARATRLIPDGNRIAAISSAQNGEEQFDTVICATGPFAAAKILADSGFEAEQERIAFDRFELGSITAVHLWFDRPILHKRTAALQGAPGQWLFTSPSGSKDATTRQTFHVQVLIKGSHRLLDATELTAGQRDALVARIRHQLELQFPEAAMATLQKSRVTTILDAVVSPSPDSFGKRPGCRTGFDNLYLAGDWTVSQWPSTMEAAVLSGRTAVEMARSSRS